MPEAKLPYLKQSPIKETGQETIIFSALQEEVLTAFKDAIELSDIESLIALQDHISMVAGICSLAFMQYSRNFLLRSICQKTRKQCKSPL